MSTATSAPLVLSAQELANFKASIDRDFAIARNHQRNGSYELVVTPQSPIYRTAEMATTHANFDGFSCSMAHLITSLYHQQCPVDAEIKAAVEKKLSARYETEEKDVYLLRVRFTFKRSTKKSRRFSSI